MKRVLMLAFIAFSFATAKAQSEVTIAYDLDSIQNPLYGDIYLMDADEEVPFYIIVDDASPVQCNKMKVKAYYQDYVNGESKDDYWVYQGEFEYPIEPYYYGYWMQMTAYTTGSYKIEVNGYMNGNYVKHFGSAEFTVYSEDDYWDYGWW